MIKCRPRSADSTGVTGAPRFSIVVPAHNEEALLGRGLEAIEGAVRASGSTAEIIVVANRCVDRTEAIARASGAIVLQDTSRSIAAIRNAGVRASTGEVVVTIDADNLLHERALMEVNRLIEAGDSVGGGCDFVPERSSVGLAATSAVLRLAMKIGRLGGVMYWCRRSDFDAIGGFDESRSCAEDLDFAYRLRRHGRSTGRGFANLRGVPVIVSCRKFDSFGDWHMLGLFARPRTVIGSIRGTDTRFADEYYYDYNTPAW